MKITKRQLRRLIHENLKKSHLLIESEFSDLIIGRVDLNDLNPSSIRPLIDRMDNPDFSGALKAGLILPVFRKIGVGVSGAPIAQKMGLSVSGPHPCRQKNWKSKSWVECPGDVEEEDLFSGYDWKYFATPAPKFIRDEANGSDFIISEVEPDNMFAVGNLGVSVVNPEKYSNLFDIVDKQAGKTRFRYR